jgi:5,10-methylene-tetrahydrofolate dehydrogenase/methenyl tetrahydrofolate cyclohydrolase
MGRPGGLTSEDLARPFGVDEPMYIIDGGIGVGIDNKPAQDLDPGVFELEYVWATKRTKAVGPLAVAYMFGNVIAATEMQLLA